MERRVLDQVVRGAAEHWPLLLPWDCVCVCVCVCVCLCVCVHMLSLS